MLASEVEGQVDILGTFLVADGVDYRLSVNRDCGDVRVVESRAQEPSTVALLFTVDDCAGRPMPGLQQGDFEIFEGQNQLGADTVRRILPDDGVQTFVSLVLDLSDSSREHLDEVIAGARAFVRQLQQDRGSSVQIGIEVFAGDQSLTRWQAPNLEADVSIKTLGRHRRV